MSSTVGFQRANLRHAPYRWDGLHLARIVLTFATVALASLLTLPVSAVATTPVSAVAPPPGLVTLDFEQGAPGVDGTIYGTHDTSPTSTRQPLIRNGYVLDVEPNSTTQTDALHFHEINSTQAYWIPDRPGPGPGVLARDSLKGGLDPLVIKSETPGQKFVLRHLVVGIATGSGASTDSVHMTGFANGQNLGSVPFAMPANSYTAYDAPDLGPLEGKQVDRLEFTASPPSSPTVFMLDDVQLAPPGITAKFVDTPYIRYDPLPTDPKLDFLSVGLDAANPMFGRTYTRPTPVFGKLDIPGNPSDFLKAVDLQITSQSTRASITVPVEQAALDLSSARSFANGPIKTRLTRLFNIPTAISSQFDTDMDDSLSLVVRATTCTQTASGCTPNGQLLLSDPYPVKKLVPVDNGTLKRFSHRDRDQGGDGWIKPHNRTVVRHLFALDPQLHFNDASNINGGFFPGATDDDTHHSHQSGDDIDARRTPNRSSLDTPETGRALLSYLQSGDGPQICEILITYQTRNPRRGILSVINGVMLANGKLATDVVKNHAKHEDHFHIRFC